ncbi:MAG: hypothetical protein CL942_05845 [Desulfovibrio sp.]|nr:hypothetical protein [Desulfovibrio sp.]|tara:strand:+ start:4008 stop:4307 length:300 start_codon:yes stop_codon:yes gene_type:complete
MSEQFTFPKTVDECRTLSFDEADAYLEKEEAAGNNSRERRKLARWAIETAYGEVVFEEIKGCNRKVNDLFSLITRATFGLSEEIKNSVRSGSGNPTRTE